MFKDIQCTVTMSILKKAVSQTYCSTCISQSYLASCYLCKVAVGTEIAMLFHPFLHYPHPHCQYQCPGSSLHGWTCTSEMEGLRRGRKRGQKEEREQKGERAEGRESRRESAEGREQKEERAEGRESRRESAEGRREQKEEGSQIQDIAKQHAHMW